MTEQKSLIHEGLLTSAEINPPGPGNPYVGGLRPTKAIINCPVIASRTCHLSELSNPVVYRVN